uniref:Relaxase n=1 Tax=Meloidogyne hapla TaxID=6305 RepID=A0A1I8BVY2_MELHA
MQSHFYLSAKNDDSIELNRKVAAEILGTKITRNELEQNSAKPQTATTTNVEENINKNEKDKEKSVKEENDKTTPKGKKFGGTTFRQ